MSQPSRPINLHAPGAERWKLRTHGFVILHSASASPNPGWNALSLAGVHPASGVAGHQVGGTRAQFTCEGGASGLEIANDPFG